MAINEITKTGRAFRKLIDKENMRWLKLSFWTSSSDVESADGKNVEEKIGAINCITSDTDNESENIAASIKSVNQMKMSFQDGVNSICELLNKLGFTPDSQSLDDVLKCISCMHEERFTEGKASAEGTLYFNLAAYINGGNPNYGGNGGMDGKPTTLPRQNTVPISIKISNGSAQVLSSASSVSSPRWVSDRINDGFSASASINSVLFVQD